MAVNWTIINSSANSYDDIWFRGKSSFPVSLPQNCIYDIRFCSDLLRHNLKQLNSIRLSGANHDFAVTIVLVCKLLQNFAALQCVIV
jgi:hypothetical protein